MPRRFRQVDVFTATPFGGNPVAVVLDCDGLSTSDMQRFANWTNLSETTFVLPPSTGGRLPGPDLHPGPELPFAGHPTLGSCHVWLESGGNRPSPRCSCRNAGRAWSRSARFRWKVAFAAPPLIRSGPVQEPLAEHLAALLGISRDAITDLAWADNGPGWVAVLLPSAEAVLALRPGSVDMDIGVAGLSPGRGAAGRARCRAFFRSGDATIEDPVTGSLNASLAQWLLDTGRLSAPYVASQGTALGRSGRVHIFREADGQIWVGGGALTCVSDTPNSRGVGEPRPGTRWGTPVLSQEALQTVDLSQESAELLIPRRRGTRRRHWPTSGTSSRPRCSTR